MGLLGGLSLILGSIRPSIFLLCCTRYYCNGVSGTVQYTVSSGAWLAITTEDIRGRALALRGTIAQMLRPLGVVIAGPLRRLLRVHFLSCKCRYPSSTCRNRTWKRICFIIFHNRCFICTSMDCKFQ